MRLKILANLSISGAILLSAMPVAAQPYGGPGYGSPDYGAPQQSGDANAANRPGTEIAPYIEVSQILTHEMSPIDDTVTYTQVAAGLDATATGRRSSGSVSLRYERNIGYGDNDISNDTISGLARGYATLVPNSVFFDAGGFASRTNVSGSGALTNNSIVSQASEGNIYSVYAGPEIQSQSGGFYIEGGARIGYSRVDAPDVIVIDTDDARFDVFDESVSYQADLEYGTRPGEVFPIGVAVSGFANQEDISNLDQRMRELLVRGDVTVPVGRTFALVGGVGYEDVEVSSRDALRDESGNPVIDDKGRFVTDSNAARVLAYDVSGLIWDAGVLWTPSPRTSLEARVGRRYDSSTYYGNFTYNPSPRTSLDISVYDELQGFGNALNNSLAGLSTSFSVTRNPTTGALVGSINGTDGPGSLAGALTSVRSSVFRNRGVQGLLSYEFGRGSVFSLAGGYDRRKFIAAEGTVLESVNGSSDENYYLTSALDGRIGRYASYSLGGYANWFESELADGQNTNAYGVSALYNRMILPKLSAQAALAYDTVNSDFDPEDFESASALIGLRYDF